MRTVCTAMLSTLWEKKGQLATSAVALAAVEQKASQWAAAEPAAASDEQQARPASPSQPGQLFWTDGKARTMPVLLRAVAMLTLLAFIAWLYVVGVLMLMAPFSKLALTLAAGVWLTSLLPCQVGGLWCTHVQLHNALRVAVYCNACIW